MADVPDWFQRFLDNDFAHLRGSVQGIQHRVDNLMLALLGAAGAAIVALLVVALT